MQSEPQVPAPGVSAPVAADPAADPHAALDRATSGGSASTEAAPQARIHGASRLEDSLYWTGHVTSLALLAIAIVLLLAARGPRRRDAIEAVQESGSGNATTPGPRAAPPNSLDA